LHREASAREKAEADAKIAAQKKVDDDASRGIPTMPANSFTVLSLIFQPLHYQ
jgi:hypothetical protein